ncbi:hypothetical protein M431DRAFT_394999 [Trichoderma harzianum CBS 226.95]|uniref:Uncharacterized protein n=1 Tax=Trichoderma harzianum CBS 226.95 TaxID=983964 RepID=A0A2T4AJ68_TRIHA|nr:hypothetical protein M431DRAFT_394999 [Trichoderma harzianum CBS 226.95]PTB57130.1 hypothetical protein M431DRAFT_394999 [Trichoderma harzianum CBS 226.95]
MALSMPYWDALFPRKLRIQSHMQAAGAEAKDQKNNFQPKLNAKAQGQKGRKAGNMHEEPLSEEREKREKKKAKANQTGRFCHVASYPVLRFSPLLFSLLFSSSSSFSPAHVHTCIHSLLPEFGICAVLDLGRKRPFTHLGPAIQVPDNAPVSPE